MSELVEGLLAELEGLHPWRVYFAFQASDWTWRVELRKEELRIGVASGRGESLGEALRAALKAAKQYDATVGMEPIWAKPLSLADDGEL